MQTILRTPEERFGFGRRAVLIGGTDKGHGITLFEPNGIGKNYGVGKRVNWTSERGFETMDALGGGFRASNPEEAAELKRDVASAANKDQGIARFVDKNPGIGVRKKAPPLIWTPDAEREKYEVC